MSIILLTNSSLLACTIVNAVSFGARYQLSDLCFHSTMDASQIRDGPFYFWGQVVRLSTRLLYYIYSARQFVPVFKLCVCVCARVNACIHTDMRTCIKTCTHTHTHARTHTHTHTHARTHTHTHTRILFTEITHVYFIYIV